MNMDDASERGKVTGGVLQLATLCEPFSFYDGLASSTKSPTIYRESETHRSEQVGM
jgi:hypothetical protein